MDFLDNAVNKAKEVFDVAYQKTNEAVNLGKQKFDIAATENKMDKDFMALGKIYFSLIEDMEIEDEKTRELVEAIKDKKARIAENKEKINARKSVVVCPECSALSDENATFCVKCGTRLKDAE